jgi:hypothetical protein
MPLPHRTPRLLLAVLGAGALAATACSSGSGEPSSPEAAPVAVARAGSDGAAPGKAGPSARCRTDALTLSLRPLPPAAGNRYAALVLTNTGGAACRTQGWPALRFTGPGGERLPTTVDRDHGHPSEPLTLEPDASMWSRLRWTVIPGEDGGACVRPTGLRVTAPDPSEPLATDWELGTVCADGHVETRALREGTGSGT